MFGCCGQAFPDEFVLIVCTKCFEQQRQVCGAKKLIDLRNFLFQIVLVSFAQTTRYKEFVNGSSLLLFCKIENGLYRFLFGIIDKATGIDHHDISLFFMDNLLVVCLKLSHQDFRVIDVFRTTQGDDIDGIFIEGFCSHTKALK